MRKYGLFLVGTLLVFSSVALVDGQQGKGKGKGGFGGFGGFRPETPFDILNRAEVKKELEVSDEQTDKLPAEMMTAISRVLTPKQFKRFSQINLQRRGVNAFKDASVQKSLKLSGEQKTSITGILDETTKELAELRKGGGGFGKGTGEKSAKIRAEAKEKIFNVLTKEQRTTWRGMVGEEFKFATPTFGGIGKGFKGGKGGKKKAAPKDF